MFEKLPEKLATQGHPRLPEIELLRVPGMPPESCFVRNPEASIGPLAFIVVDARNGRGEESLHLDLNPRDRAPPSTSGGEPQFAHEGGQAVTEDYGRSSGADCLGGYPGKDQSRQRAVRESDLRRRHHHQGVVAVPATEFVAPRVAVGHCRLNDRAGHEADAPALPCVFLSDLFGPIEEVEVALSK